MKTVRPFYPLALLCGTSILHAAVAAPPEQIIVTGMRTEQLQLNSPAAVSVITREEIEQSGAITIADVLRARAGLQIRDTIGDGGRGVVVSMRGFGENAANNTLILVDGRKLNNPTLQPPDLNSVALKDIERIEVLQGGAGVLFGDQAVGGVINIVTRTPEKAALAVEAGAGSEGGQRVSAIASQRFANGVGARLSAEQRSSDNYRDNNASDYRNVLGLLEYEWSDGRVFGEAQYIDDQLEFPGALPVEMASRDRRQTIYPDDFGDLETYSWRLGGRYALSAHWSAEMELTERNSDGNGYQFSANTTDMRVRTANPRLIGEYRSAAGLSTVTVGFDATDSDYEFEIPEYFFLTDFSQEQRDVYAQIVHPLSSTVQVSFGARRAEVADENHGNGTRNSDSETVTTASIAWQFHESMRLLLRRDEVLRYANVDENGFTLPSVTFLAPQTGTSLEGGIEWFAERFNGRAVVFDLDLDDEILYDPSAPGPSAEFGSFGANINLESSSRQGALLEWQWAVSPRLSIGGSYTYTDAEVTSGTFDGNEIPYVSEHVGALNGTWNFGYGINAYVEYAYSGSRRALGDDANIYPGVDSEGLVNMALRWANGDWYTSLRANNLLNEEYDTLTTATPYGRSVYPAPERMLFLSVGYAL